MPIPITIKIGAVMLRGRLKDIEAGRALVDRLPLEVHMSRWGEEYYGAVTPPMGDFPGPVKDVMEVGELTYYGQYGWLCLFFGPTPASRGEEPRGMVEMLSVGRVDGDFAALGALGESVVALIESA